MPRKRKRHTPMNRSQMMQAVHSVDTQPELLVRRALFQAGFRYRLRKPKSNSDFWSEKFTNNVVRDIKTGWKLSLMGYRVATVWECSVKNNLDQTIERLVSFIKGDEETIEI